MFARSGHTGRVSSLQVIRVSEQHLPRISAHCNGAEAKRHTIGHAERNSREAQPTERGRSRTTAVIHSNGVGNVISMVQVRKKYRKTVAKKEITRFNGNYSDRFFDSDTSESFKIVCFIVRGRIVSVSIAESCQSKHLYSNIIFAHLRSPFPLPEPPKYQCCQERS